MDLTVNITADIESRLRERAAVSGKDVGTFVREAVEEKLNEDESFLEILAPVHNAFRKSGMTDQHAMELFERTRQQARQKSPKPPKMS